MPVTHVKIPQNCKLFKFEHQNHVINRVIGCRMHRFEDLSHKTIRYQTINSLNMLLSFTWLFEIQTSWSSSSSIRLFSLSVRRILAANGRSYISFVEGFTQTHSLCYDDNENLLKQWFILLFFWHIGIRIFAILLCILSCEIDKRVSKTSSGWRR